MGKMTEGPFTLTAAEDLEIYRRVMLDSSGEAAYADAKDLAIGITLEKVSDGDPVSIHPINAAGTVLVTAAGAFSRGDLLYGAADGKVDDIELGDPQYIAFEAASGDGSQVEALPIRLGVDVKLVTGGVGGIAASDLVYVSDQTDGIETVLPAQGTSAGRFANYICPNAIAAAAQGVALATYLLAAVDTSASSAAGDPVYLSDATAGGYTLTKPTGTDKVQIVGYVVEDHATTGAILFQLPGFQQIVHTHADNSEGGTLDWDNVWSDAVHTHSSAAEGGDAIAAANITVADAGTFTTETEVESALQEIYQHILSAQAQVNIPLLSAVELNGTLLAAFADAADPTPGLAVVDSESVGIRWNNHANPDEIIVNVPMPQDLDDAADIVLHLLASKVGATLADAVTFTVGAFFQTVGALHDADANAGGASSAMTGDAATKTVAELTLTIAAADVPAAPCLLTLTIQPTDGLLGTDDVVLHGAWLEYTRKALTA